jgi:hypothetical protein
VCQQADTGEWWDAAERFLLHYHVNNGPRTTARKLHAHGGLQCDSLISCLGTHHKRFMVSTEEQGTYFPLYGSFAGG